MRFNFLSIPIDNDKVSKTDDAAAIQVPVMIMCSGSPGFLFLVSHAERFPVFKYNTLRTRPLVAGVK